MGNNHNYGGLLYSRLPDCYDILFRWLTYPRQKVMIRRIDMKPGARVLDLGVGTGLSLPLYPKHCKVTGVDISPRMLLHARRRARIKNLTHVSLVEMDALKIDRGFPANTFDVTIAAFVLTVVEDPIPVLLNVKKIGKPGSSLFVLSYCQCKNGLIRRCEKALDPVCRKLGWNYKVDMVEAIEEAGLSVVSTRPCFPLDPYVIIQARIGER